MDLGGLGRQGEQAAADFLVEQGMRVVARNWRCRHGEVDLVCIEGETLVFCEVKTRRGEAHGGPLAAITPEKAARLRRLVGAYLAAEGPHPGPLRIDAVGILWRGSGPWSILHIRGAA